ncbi:MAG TPA: hypothetical protein DD490_26600 [Acidobacteria bacterium]|nr:hypothetical protein [Acidobacteriota bacterium]
MSVDYIIRTIIVIALIAAYWYIRKKKKEAEGPVKKTGPGAPRPAVERPVKPADPPEVVYANLRKRAFETSPQSLGQAGDVKEDEAYAFIMEMGIADTVLTLACFADGDAGLYYQSGGGMKGGGAHENIRKAAKALMALVPKALPQMAPSTAQPLPEPGQVFFHALTPRGTLTAQTDRESLVDTENPLGALFFSGQEVVAQMRQVQAQKAG